MAIKICFRRFVALLLCCLLVGSSFARSAYASDPVTAASLAIAGGQLAGAGLAGEAGAASLAGPVGIVVGLTLAACGVNAYVTKASQEAGMSRTKFVVTKLSTWAYLAGYTQQQILDKISQGVSVAADGTIELGKEAAKTIEQFGNWLFSQEGEVVPSISSSEAGTITIDDYTFSSFADTLFVTGTASSTQSYNYIISDGGPIFVGRVGGTFYIYTFTANTQYNYLRYGSNGVNDINELRTIPYTQTNRSGVVMYYSPIYPSVNGDIVFVPNLTLAPQDWLYTFTSTSGTPSFGETQAADDVFTGTPEQWAENKDVLNPSAEDTPVVLNPDLLNPIIESLTDGQQATMSIIDYLQALQDAWDHALDDVQTAIGTITDSLTGIQEQIAVPQEAVKNPSITNPGVTPDTTPILDPSTVDPGTVVTGLSFDLTQIFPFCIPFDIYDMLATLSATPEAPVYHVHYEGPYNIVIDFTVDLTPWNSVASVLRTVELLAFCIGLAYVTRSMFIRS